MNKDEDVQQKDDVSPNADANDRIIRKGALAPGLPKDFKVEQVGAAIRLRVTDRNRAIARSGSVSYSIGWANSVDTTTTAGLDAGAARCEFFPSLPAPGIEDRDVTLFLQDTRYQTGVFYCFGVDRDGTRSKSYLWTSALTNVITDLSIPGDGKHLQISENGEGNGDSTVSVMAVSIQAPNPLGSLDLFQLYFKNYPSLGDFEEGDSARYTGAAGGTIQFQARNAVGRRKGTGTITGIAGAVISGTGTRFTHEVNVGGLFEALGVQGIVQSLTDTAITLTSAWTGKAIVSFTDFYLYPLVTVYCVSVSKGGTRRTDIENAPSVSLVLDGNDSAPNAPTFTANPVGNAIRLDITPVIGTRVEHYNVYRGTGSGLAFTACALIGSVKHDPTNILGTIPYSDENFTLFQREQQQVFSYFVTSVMRATTPLESAASAEVDGACRLDSPADGGAPMPARFPAASLTWNNMFSGTPGPVLLADGVQDTQMNLVRPAGFNRWVGSASGGGSTPGFQNGTEVILAMAGGIGSAGSSILTQKIGGWDGANGRVPKGKMVTVQFKVYHTPGTVNGSLQVQAAHYNGVPIVGLAFLRRRLSTDVLDYTSTNLVIPGSEIIATPQIYWGAFLLRDNVPTTEIELQIAYVTTSYSGVNLVITEPMLSLGDGLPYWSAPIDPNTLYGPPGVAATVPPGRFVDRDGSVRDWIPLP